MTSKMSVIVPTYNADTTLARCIDSILTQTFADFELILVDDGSTDASPRICDEYERIDARVKVIHKRNGGVSSARNMGLDKAQGSYIVFIDSDDTVDANYLDILYQQGKYDFVTGGYQTQGPDGRWHEQRFAEDATTRQHVSAFPSKYMGKYYFGVTCAKLYKKEIIDKYGLRFPIDVHNGEDSLFIFQFLTYATSIKIVPYCGYNYFFYPSSLAHRTHINNFRWRIQVEKQVMKFFNPCNLEEIRWLDERCFEVLVNQIRIHMPHLEHGEVYLLYEDELFSRCIAHKKKCGSPKEQFFIYAMDHKHYEFYDYFHKLDLFFIRVRNKLKRIICGAN